MNEKTLIDQVKFLLRKAHEAEITFLNRLSEAERSAQGSYTHWSPKDTIGHITYWRRRTVETLAYLARGQAPLAYPPYEETNREVFKENHPKPLAALMKESDAALSALIEVMDRFLPEDLTDAQRFSSRAGKPLLSYILENGYLHVVNHLAGEYVKLGDRPMAVRLQEAAIGDVTPVDPSPASRGLALYDLACLHAGGGEIDKALSALKEAFEIYPELVEWAAQDADLAGLHVHPAFQELVKKP